MSWSIVGVAGAGAGAGGSGGGGGGTGLRFGMPVGGWASGSGVDIFKDSCLIHLGFEVDM